MLFKKFFIWLIKNLIILLLVTLIFSAISLDFPRLIQGVIEDIFKYATPLMQKQVISKLAETCSTLDKDENVVTINQICTNKTVLDSMKKDCENYILCKEYKAGKINDKEFFLNIISDTIPTQLELPRIEVLDKYNQVTNYLNKNKILYFIILLVLMITLYLLIIDVKLFLIILSGISLSIGILIMLPYLAIIAYDKFVGIDTTPILGSMFSAGNIFDAKAILSVILLLFLRTYNSFIITIGILFLIIGIAGKVYWFILKRLGKSSLKGSESKKKEKVKELLDDLEEQATKVKKKF